MKRRSCRPHSSHILSAPPRTDQFVYRQQVGELHKAFGGGPRAEGEVEEPQGPRFRFPSTCTPYRSCTRSQIRGSSKIRITLEAGDFLAIPMNSQAASIDVKQSETLGRISGTLVGLQMLR